jgi:hypothetical protein
MPILMKTRGTELDAARADAEIALTRRKVTELLSNGPKMADGSSPARDGEQGETKENFAMTVLARRLAHIELSAGRVARLAARPVIADENEHAH